MQDNNKTKKKRRKQSKMCHFKDVPGFKPTPASTVRSHIMMRNSQWGQFPNNHVLSKVGEVKRGDPYKVNESILQEDVGIDDDEFLLEFKRSIASDELLTFCTGIVRRHDKIMLRTAYCAKKLDDPGCQHIMTVKDVYSLVHKSVQSVFPSKLLGSKTNWQTFLPKLKQLMYQGYSGALLVNTLMKDIKQSDVIWLRPLPYSGQRQRIVAKILRWIINWALTYISSFWHVAYSSDGLKFFDRRYWQKLEDQTYNNMIKAGKLTISASTSEYPVNAALRFIPKGEGCRPLLMVQRERNDLCQWNVRAFLKCVVKKYEWKCSHRGDLQDVSSVLQKLASLRKMGKILKLYFVKVDIDDAFGSINHRKLQIILKRIFESLVPENYEVIEHKFEKLLRSGFIKEFLDYQFGDKRCGTPKGFLHKSETVRNVKEVIALLEMCTNISVRFHGKDHVMTQGVGQGYKLSSFLSEVYYRDMLETHFLSFLTNPYDHLLRYADDILFITPDQDQARLFFEITKAGIPDYNCRMNPSKTHTNVDAAASSSLVRYLGGVIDFDSLTLTPFFRAYIKGTVKSVKLDKGKYKIVKPKTVLLNCANVCGARNDPWFLDPRANGKKPVLKTIEEGSCFLAQRLVKTESSLSGVSSSKLLMWKILQFGDKTVKSCRRTLSTRFPSSGRDILDKEIEMASLRGVLRVVCTYAKWKRVYLAVRHKMRKLRAI